MEGVLRRCEGAKGWGMRNKVRVPCENGAWILSVIAACEGSIEAESHRRPRQQLPERDLAGRKRARKSLRLCVSLLANKRRFPGCDRPDLPFRPKI